VAYTEPLTQAARRRRWLLWLGRRVIGASSGVMRRSRPDRRCRTPCRPTLRTGVMSTMCDLKPPAGAQNGDASPSLRRGGGIAWSSTSSTKTGRCRRLRGHSAPAARPALRPPRRAGRSGPRRRRAAGVGVLRDSPQTLLLAADHDRLPPQRLRRLIWPMRVAYGRSLTGRKLLVSWPLLPLARHVPVVPLSARRPEQRSGG
jgi:hypothetical protein